MHGAKVRRSLGRRAFARVSVPVDSTLRCNSRCLGPLEVRDGPSSLPLGGPRQRSVLALLLLDPGREVDADRMVTEIWGDRSTETAHGTRSTPTSRTSEGSSGAIASCGPMADIAWGGRMMMWSSPTNSTRSSPRHIGWPDRTRRQPSPSSTSRWHGGEAGHTMASRTFPPSRPRSPGWRNSGSAQSRTGSGPSSTLAARPRSVVSRC